MTVTAPPRPPRPSDPVDREELEALVQALIEEARRRARRRRLLFAAAAASIALLGVGVFAVSDRTAQSQPTSAASAGRSGLPVGAASSKIAFLTNFPAGSSFRPDLYEPQVQMELYVMNPDGSGKRRLVSTVAKGQTGTGLGDAAIWSPSGLELAFTLNGHVHVMNADGSGQRNLTPGVSGGALAWAPNGRMILFAKDEGSIPVLYVVNTDGSVQRQVTAVHSWAPAWSPDGRRIAFASILSGTGNSRRGEVLVVNVDGSGLQNLTGTLGGDSPAWSADGRTIAFRTYLPKPPGRKGFRPRKWLYLMNADGSEPRELVRLSDSDGSFAWSPDGRQIAFVSDRDGNDEVYVVNADGGGLRNLTRNPARDGHPVWSSDGKTIGFVGKRGGNRDIYVMNADGSNQRNLTRDLDRQAFGISWAPEPRS